MPNRNDAAVEFLKTRRSRPAKTLKDPAPDRTALTEFLTMAARTPDHGKLEPWRFVVLGREALTDTAAKARARAEALGKDADAITKAGNQFDVSPLAVVVIESPKPSEKIPAVEMTYSAGAVCLALVNAALASGWGANWLSGWISFDDVFTADAFGLEPHERVAGIIHIGTETNTPPERPRPDIEAITDWRL